MNHTIRHRSPLDVRGARASGLERLPFAEGLYRTKGSSGSVESAVLETPAPFDDLVLSVSADVPEGGELELAAKTRRDGAWSGWFALGVLRADGWTSPAPAAAAEGAVDVDTLTLARPADALRYRLRLRAAGKPVTVRSVAAAVSGGPAPDAPPPAAPGPWTRELPVTPRSQMEEQAKYKNDVCSPASLAMTLEFWGLKESTESVALAVRDRGSALFGNWPANVAYAAKLGLEGAVARLESLADLEAEIADGRPVVVSVAYGDGELPGSPIPRTKGHLVVVCGFTPEGDVITADPAAPDRASARRVYPRAAFHRAWRARKRGLAYLLGPSFPRRMTVGVAVADLWTKPSPARRGGVKLDDPAHLSQLLYGESVTVLEAQGDWAKVRAEEQDSFLPAGAWQGYPGWARADALVSARPPETDAVVRVRQALLHRGEEIIPLSVGTRLKRVSHEGGMTRVRLLDGGVAELPADQLYHAPDRATEASRAEIIRTAELFLGTSYYWGGRSGVQPDPKIGVDCSGLVSLAYRIHGRDVPRDSHEQKLKSRPVRRAELMSGDLVFLTDDASSDRVTHVMIFTGGDGLIESRKSSGRVLRTTFLERFGQPLASLESGDVLTDQSFAKPRRRRIFFGSYF